MKIKITESQLRKINNEAGGYDDEYMMGQHAQSVQGPLLHSFSETVEILYSFIAFSKSEDFTKENALNFISNFSSKVDGDIKLIKDLLPEIYVDNDFVEMVKKYGYSLKKLNNYLKLLYSNSSTLSFDMTRDEVINAIYEQIVMMEECIEEMSTMFGVVHSRYRSRLGFE
jgi:hypothetical protein